MRKLRLAAGLCLIAGLLLPAACASEDAPSEPAKTGAADGDGELETESETLRAINVPADGRLYAAAGMAVITPNETNHPCDMFMGGTGNNRRPEGVRDDLEARALILAEGDESIVLIAMDLVGWLIPDVDLVRDGLADLGFDRDRIVVASTHSHTAPDTIGVWGENFAKSGRCPEYAEFLAQTAIELALSASHELKPVTAYAAQTEFNETQTDYPALINDYRTPEVINPTITAARFVDDDGNTVSTLVNWHAHPEVLIGAREYSADFPRWTREKLEENYGGTSVYFSGTVGGLLTILEVSVPERTRGGAPVLEDGERVFIKENNETKAWSLGFVLAEAVIAALDQAEEISGSLKVDSIVLRLPFENEQFILAMKLGVIPGCELVTDDPDLCGRHGCLQQPIHHVRIGRLHFITLPGEVFPETSIGREEITHDYGDPWGTHVYPAMTGYRSALPEGHMLVEIGLANNEIGYITPAADYEENDHPNYYTEYFSISEKTERILREAVTELLAQ